ncbi:MAG: glycine betaine ABC transporter substrate-binding protein [Peptostreptococcaceae bacterium]
MIKDMISLFLEQKEFFYKLFIEHIEITSISILIAIVLGLLIGIMLSEYKKIANVVIGIINFLYTIPSISMLGFLIPFTGIGNNTAIIALTIYALLPMVRNTYTGIVQVDEKIVEASIGMGSTNLQTLFKVKLPLAFLVIFSGIRNMVTMTIALGGIASFIGAGGLGVAIYQGITTNNSTMTLLGSLLIAFLALFSDLVLGFIEYKIKNRKISIKKVSIIPLILILCFGVFTLFKNENENIIKIATKPMTEQYILSEILGILIEENTDLEVSITKGIGGGTSNIHPAMIKGEFDIYPEYTGTAWNMVLNEDSLYKDEYFESLNSNYNNDFDMTWVGMYGFNNTFSVAVRKEIAEKYDLKNYSDLERVSDELIFGAEYDFFGRQDGFDDLVDTYHLNFKDTVAMDIGLKYQAINNGQIDVMNVFTTDGQLSVSDVVVLNDDKNLYPSYLCGNIILNQTLEKYPELNEIFLTVTDLISDDDISRMNYLVESEGMSVIDVSKDFLKSKNLIN